jgi:LCP family protein required for cell wall assembly
MAPAASPSPSASPVATASPNASASPSPIAGSLASNPFTVLLLGADRGSRTDTVIVVGIDPVKRAVTYASLPRDTINVPMPDRGRFGQRKINEFYRFAKGNPKRFPEGPGQATKEMVGQLLGIRVDYYALTTFDGFAHMVDSMGGVKVTVPKSVVDPTYQISSENVGIRFKKGPQVMTGPRALIYVRTRGGDNDFERSRRQQVFLTAAGSQLLSRENLLAALVAVQPGNLKTDFPLDQVSGLLTAFGLPPKSSDVRGVVLGPKTYSSKASCSCGYALEPDLPAMRQVAAELFPWAVSP